MRNRQNENYISFICELRTSPGKITNIQCLDTTPGYQHFDGQAGVIKLPEGQQNKESRLRWRLFKAGGPPAPPVDDAHDFVLRGINID